MCSNSLAYRCHFGFAAESHAWKDSRSTVWPRLQCTRCDFIQVNNKLECEKRIKLREGYHAILVYFVGFDCHSSAMALHFEGSFDVGHLHSEGL